MWRLVGILVVIVGIIYPSGAMAAHYDLVYPRYSAKDDPRDQFPLAILKLALDKMKVDYTITPAAEVMERTRAVASLQAGEGVNVMWSSMGMDLEKNLRPILLPIHRGLLGYRLFIINKNLQSEFAKVNTLDDLKKFTAGQGVGWADIQILGSAGLKVASNKYDLLFKQLDAGNIDYFSRGANEAFTEVAAHRETEPSLIVENHVLVVYRSDQIFYFAKAREDLAATVEKGLLAAYEDGSYMQLFNESPLIQQTLKNAAFNKRIRIEIPNPLLSDEAKATGEITDQITAIQGSTTTAAADIDTIAQIISELSRATSSIASAVEAQNTATAEISRAIDFTANSTRELGETVAKVATTAEQSGRNAYTVLETAGEVNQRYDTMSGKVQTFLSSVRAS